MTTNPTPPEAWDRNDAMRNVTVLDLQQPLVRFLTDEELAKADELTREMRSTLRILGHDAADLYVLATLEAALRNERARREELIYEARIALESNGHEAYINHDEVKHQQDGNGWSAQCSCVTQISGWHSTRAEAIEEGGLHIADHDGRWAAEEVDTD